MNFLALLCLNPFGFGLKALIISGLHHSCRATYITLYFNIYLNNNTMGILSQTCFLETIFVVEVFSNTKHANNTSISPNLLLSFYYVTIKFQIFLILRITFWVVICLVLQSSELNQIYLLIKNYIKSNCFASSWIWDDMTNWKTSRLLYFSVQNCLNK